MEIQIKMLKRLISILCAATMVASGAMTSVGAVNRKDVIAAWQKVEDFDAKINQLKEQKVRIESERQTLIRNLDEQIKKDNESKLKLIVEIGNTGQNNERKWQKIENSIEESKKLKQEVIDNINAEISKLNNELKKAEEEKKKLNIQANNLLKQLEKKEYGIKKPNEIKKEISQRLNKEKLRKENKIQIAFSPTKKNRDIKPQIRQKSRDNAINELNNSNNNDYAKFWEEIEAGSQDDRSGKYENLCWLMSARNVLNYFDLMEKNSKPPVRGVQKVIKEYLASGGQLDVAKKAASAKKAVNSKTTGKSKKAASAKKAGKSKPAFIFDATMKTDGDITKWLKRNGISTLTVANESLNKKVLIKYVKEQIVAHFYSLSQDIDCMAPIIIGEGSHWQTIVNYRKDTGKVTGVNSLSSGDKGIVFEENIDEFIEKLIYPSDYDKCLRISLIFTAKKAVASNIFEPIRCIDQEDIDKRVEQVRIEAEQRKSDEDTKKRIIEEAKKEYDIMVKNSQNVKEEISKF